MVVITGRVTDQHGKGIYNAHVIFTGPDGGRNVQQGAPTFGTVTDFEGYYQFESLGGQYLTASHAGSNPVTKKIDFVSNFASGRDYHQEINFKLGGGLTLPTFEIIEKAKTWAKENKLVAYSALGVLGLSIGIAIWGTSKKK